MRSSPSSSSKVLVSFLTRAAVKRAALASNVTHWVKYSFDRRWFLSGFSFWQMMHLRTSAPGKLLLVDLLLPLGSQRLQRQSCHWFFWSPSQINLIGKLSCRRDVVIINLRKFDRRSLIWISGRHYCSNIYWNPIHQESVVFARLNTYFSTKKFLSTKDELKMQKTIQNICHL